MATLVLLRAGICRKTGQCGRRELNPFQDHVNVGTRIFVFDSFEGLLTSVVKTDLEQKLPVR